MDPNSTAPASNRALSAQNLDISTNLGPLTSLDVEALVGIWHSYTHPGTISAASYGLRLPRRPEQHVYARVTSLPQRDASLGSGEVINSEFGRKPT